MISTAVHHPIMKAKKRSPWLTRTRTHHFGATSWRCGGWTSRAQGRTRHPGTWSHNVAIARRYVRARPRLIRELDKIGVSEHQWCKDELGNGNSPQ
jgi:hypothetical protein